jgi:hypothetical protein
VWLKLNLEKMYEMLTERNGGGGGERVCCIDRGVAVASYYCVLWRLGQKKGEEGRAGACVDTHAERKMGRGA